MRSRIALQALDKERGRVASSKFTKNNGDMFKESPVDWKQLGPEIPAKFSNGRHILLGAVMVQVGGKMLYHRLRFSVVNMLVVQS